MSSEENRQANTWNMLCHLTALSFLIGVPFGHILGPLIIWLIKKDEFSSVDEHFKESLNFQISITIYAVIAGILTLIVIGIPMLIAIAIADVVLVIMATVKVNKGERYRYPCTIRLVK